MLSKSVFIPALGLALLGALVLAGAVGAVRVAPSEIISASTAWLFGAESLSASQFIWLKVRLPRIILSAIVGASLAISGTALQGLFRNPMAEPYIIGVSSGGALGATLVLMFGEGLMFLSLSLPVFAFLGALAATGLVYGLSRVDGRVSTTTLLLAGIAVSSFVSALISLLMALNGEDLYSVFFWLMGSFSARNWGHVQMILPFFVIGSATIFFYYRELNVMLLGDDKAAHLGVDLEKARPVLLGATALLAGAAVSVSGLIGFVGLIVPHIVRLIIGPDHKTLIPAAALGGALFMVVTDIIARTVLSPTEIPIGIVTALFGAPFFIYLLRTRRRTIG